MTEYTVPYKVTAVMIHKAVVTNGCMDDDERAKAAICCRRIGGKGGSEWWV